MVYTKTVLIAEAHEPTRATLRNALAVQGYRVFDARDVMEAEAVSRGIGGPLHLLVTDLALPDGNGIELAWRLVRRFPLLRVLVLSAHCEDVVCLDPRMAERVAFLAKPVRPAAFTAKVSQVLASPAPPMPPRVRAAGGH